jgi:hypothetical protein
MKQWTFSDFTHDFEWLKVADTVIGALGGFMQKPSILSFIYKSL